MAYNRWKKGVAIALSITMLLSGKVTAFSSEVQSTEGITEVSEEDTGHSQETVQQEEEDLQITVDPSEEVIEEQNAGEASGEDAAAEDEIDDQGYEEDLLGSSEEKEGGEAAESSLTGLSSETAEDAGGEAAESSGDGLTQAPAEEIENGEAAGSGQTEGAETGSTDEAALVGATQEIAVPMPAQTFRFVTPKGIRVEAKAEEGVFPEGTTLQVKDIDKQDATSAAQEQSGEQEVVDAVGVDITFFDAEGNEIQPTDSKGLRVKIELPRGGELKDNAAEETEQSFALLHVDEEGEVKELEKAEVDKFGAEFDAESFSVYVLAVYALETYYRSFDGETFKITIEYDDSAEIPVDAQLSVSEILPDTAEYEEYLSKSCKALGLEDLYQISFARYFDIEIISEGQRIEPKSPVKVKIEYADAIGKYADDDLSIVHFADDGTEVISDVQLSGDGKELVYEQSGFSVTGTIVSTPQEGSSYAVVVKYEDVYYVVENDGTLLEADYDPEANTVKLDYPLLWSYTSDRGADGSTYRNIRIRTQASHFDSQQLPDSFYYRYIDPNTDSGITEEEKKSGPDEQQQANQQHPGYVQACALNYSDHKIQGNGTYIGVDEQNMRIKGNASAQDAAEVYFAEVTTVPPSGNINNTVNHIDISIDGGATLSVPLAYGDYYYYVGGEKRTLHVEQGEDVTLNLKVNDINITPEDMKHAEITAYSQKSGLLNDAFYITGYTQNAQSGYSTPQVRCEGSFKVADIDPFTNTSEERLTQEQLQSRLDNRIYYTVTAKKEVTFQWMYTYGLDGENAQLYSVDGEELSSTVMVNLSKSFDYWDEGNECPPIHLGGTTGEEYWRQGHIMWDTSAHNGSGMDFTLDADIDEQQAGVVAIEITKYLRTEDGDVISPRSEITNQFIVYQKTPASASDIASVVDKGTGAPGDTSKPEDFQGGYSGIHAKTVTVGTSGEGLVYDYDVHEGMAYIKEDEGSIRKLITDTDGKEWVYDHTEVETEYVWRENGDERKPMHGAEGLSSYPEVIGNYGRWIDDQGVEHPLFNGFLTFFVTNIYKPKDEPHKKEITPYEGTGTLGMVKVGDEITYEISYMNYKSTAADVVIKDTLDDNVKYVRSSDNGTHSGGDAGGKVEWTISGVPAGQEGKVTLTVKVLEGALKSKNGPGKVVNGGDTTTVKIGNDDEYTVETVENPVPEKVETQPYQGSGVLGPVQVGDEIEYEIYYKNYKEEAATVTIVDTLDKNVEYVSSTPEGTYADGKVTWTLADVAAGTEGSVTLKVKVLESALTPNKVINEGTTIQVGNDSEFELKPVENPVPEDPHKKEVTPYEGTGSLGMVNVGDEITYEISFKNYKKEAADVKIMDTLDKNVEFVSADKGGVYDEAAHVVNWTFKDVAAGKADKVTLKVKVLEGALKSKKGPGEVVNGGDTATVDIGNDHYTLEEVRNPVPEKVETDPYQGSGVLGPVKVGDEITYQIYYKNYLDKAADVVIKDKLDPNVEFVSASDSGAPTAGVVFWTLRNVAAGEEGSVTLKVKVLESALTPNKVINEGTKIQVGNEDEFELKPVENPVPEPPHKKETAPYEGTGSLGMVNVGDTITYEISYENYFDKAVEVKIKDTLDPNVEFVSADNGGVYDEAAHVVNWTIKDVAAGKVDKVTLKVKVLEGALKSKDGPGEVVNGGDTTTVDIDNDHYTVEEVENPVPEKVETQPYQGSGVLGAVKVGDEIEYEIYYKNYKEEAATVTIVDTLDKNVEYVSSTPEGTFADGKVTWTLADVAAGTEGSVTLKVKVLESALTPNKVINEGTTIRVGNDSEFELKPVENPVPDEPHKKEIDPYEGIGVLGPVKVGDEITYEISYHNYKSEAATVTIKDTLDPNVQYVSSSDNGVYADGVVTWTLANVAADKEGTVTMTVKVLEGALESKGGEGKVVNGGDTTTVQVGNDAEYSVEVVENPVPEPHKEEITPYQGINVLGPVKVGDEITYQITYKNYKEEKADVKIKDTLDPNVEFVSASDSGTESSGVVNWTIKDVEAGKEGTVTLTVKVLEGALKSKGGKGEVVNGGDTTTVQVGNDSEYSVETVTNPVPEEPHKREIDPYVGTGVLGGVKVGDEITYEISYINYEDEAADVKIMDTLDENVEFLNADNGGTYDSANHVVNWILADVPAGEVGAVTMTVKVLEGALQSKGGEGKVVNGGDSTTVQVGNGPVYNVEVVENPVPEPPVKEETNPYQGTGDLGAVKVGDEITYEISYINYKQNKADVTIKDTLDENVEFISASDGGTADSGIVTWVIKDVEAGKEGKVTLIVKVLEGALQSKGGAGEVENGPGTTVKVGNDNEYEVETVTNPVPEPPHKKETDPYEGTGTLGGVKVGDEITYEISYINYEKEAADVKIMDTLDPNVEFVDADNGGVYDAEKHVVNWTVTNVDAGKEDKVTLTVKVLEGALQSKGGEGKVVNGGDTTTVQVGNGPVYNVEVVENPVPEPPVKEEVTPYEGTGELGAVKVGDEITYEISYINYKQDKADVTIKDTLDPNVEFVSASDEGTEDNGVVNWTIKDVEAGKEGKVTLTVKVLEGALESKGGEGEVVNGGPGTTVKVGNDNEYEVNTVTNPVPEEPHKKEIAPYEGIGELGGVKVGDEITYEISYKNYKKDTANVTIKDTLDPNVEFVSASDGGAKTGNAVFWTIRDVEAGKDGTVTLTVKVLEGALESKGGEGEVVNGGPGTTVKVGNDNEYEVEVVENPVPEEPHKKEITPYEGTGELGAVKVGDEITYEISYKNYKKEAANVVIKDTLDKNVEFVSASDSGEETDGIVNWTIENVEAGKEGTVTLTVRVLEGALKSKEGPGKVVNGGDSTTVKVGNDQEYSVEVVENPVPEPPVKTEVTPYEGTGVLGAVKVGDEITYEISYINYKSTAANVVIKDTLDKNVEFVSASDGGKETDGVVNWTIENVEAGKEGKVSLTVKVLEGALESKEGPGKVINGGDNTTVKVGNDNEYTVEPVENPVPEEPHKKEITPYEGTGELGAVKVGDEITYEISYKNYKKEAANVVIKDTLDPNVEFVSASDEGAHTGEEAGGIVNWTIENVEAGKEGTVTLTVKVLEGALKSKEGPGKVVNGGDSTTVKVGNDQEYSVEVVENPVPEPPVPEEPHKREISPYKGNGTLGEVNVGDEITYEISYKNYKDEAVDVVIKDTLDKNVEYVSSSDGGKLVNGVVIWTLKDVEAGKAGKVTLTVKVLKGALKSNGGPGKVVNGGPSATVKIGNDDEVSLEIVENPVKEKQVPPPPHKSRTGDNNPIGLLLLLMALAGGGLAAVIVYRRKQIKE